MNTLKDLINLQIEMLEKNISNRENEQLIIEKLTKHDNKLEKIEEELYSSIPGKEGIFYKINKIETKIDNGFKELKERNIKEDAIKTLIISVCSSLVGSGCLMTLLKLFVK